MDRFKLSQKRQPDFGPKLALLATAAVASVALTGCTTGSAPRADVSVNKAEVALKKGEVNKAITHAEAAVLANPRDASFRALLGTAYLEAGRFQSASQSFGDALELGDDNPRTVLSYALAKTAVGEKKAALAKLSQWERSLDPADAGLALALAGDPQRGVFLLTNALRSGQNNPKIRQNLAYTYALAGNWRAARVMAAEDVPADQIDARLSDWASKAKPEDYMVRVADLLQVTPVSDAGVPGKLALVNFPSSKQMMAEAKLQGAGDTAPAQVAKAPAAKSQKTKPKTVAAPAKPSQSETMAYTRGGANEPVEKVDPTVASILAATGGTPSKVATAKPAAKSTTAPRRITAAQGRMASNETPALAPVKAAAPMKAPKPASVADVAPSALRFVSRPMVQDTPAASAEKTAPRRVASAPKPAPKRVARAAPKGDSHLIQLGSYNSQAEAKAGWTTLKRKFPQLRDHDVVITKAEVKGRTYYRVAAAGFGKQGASQMCRTVKSSGRGCFAYGKNNPPAGAVDSGTRVAARSR
ncbi:MAG: SPOR domain-containing protein [Pseudomonadota bacterium]